MQRFIDVLDRPDRSYPVIHIAGTNGKGSTAAMLEQIFRSAGYKTGLFTSPHLVYLGERIQVNRVPVTPDQIKSLIGELDIQAALIGKENADNHPTFFEFMAAMAMVHFKHETVDVAIIETGLGGRLDATNVVDPLVSVITSIGLDHTEILGESIEEIAGEKAGIIKPGRTVILGRVPEGASDVMKQVATERCAPLMSVEEKYGDSLEDYPETNLHGTFQRWNAATAVTTCEYLEDRFPGIKAVSKSALQQVEWAGRWQIVKLPCGRTLILDATHNPEGSRFLDENLEHLESELGRKPWVIAGTLGVMRAQYLIPVASRHAKGLYLVEPAQPRSAGFDVLRSYIPADVSLPVEDSSIDQLFPGKGICTVGEPGDTIVVTGSIYLLGEVLERLSEQVKEVGASFQDLF